jgi:DNA-binding transcriptional MerR regulator
MEKFLCARVAARRLGISVSALHRLANRGTIAYVRVSFARYFRASEIERLLADPGYLRRSRARKTLSLAELEAKGQLTLARELES